MWLSEEKLRFAKDEADPDLNWMDFDLWRDHDRFSVSGDVIQCPSCDAPMTVLDYADTGVHVDYCDSCRGVWLDQGEFGSIIASLAHELRNKTVPEYLSASLKEAGDLVRSDEGLLSNWKDLHTVLRMLKYRIMSRTTGVVRILADLQHRNPIQ
jgi:Zn-finger nucleic acid-binding protein